MNIKSTNFSLSRYAGPLGAYACGCLTIMVIAYFVVTFLIGIPRITSWCRPKDKLPFKSEIWLESQIGTNRFMLANDLVANERLKNISRQEVDEILGTPKGYDKISGDSIAYHLCNQEIMPARNFLFSYLFANTEMWVLVIEFDDMRVSNYYIEGR